MSAAYHGPRERCWIGHGVVRNVEITRWDDEHIFGRTLQVPASQTKRYGLAEQAPGVGMKALHVLGSLDTYHPITQFTEQILWTRSKL